MQANGYDLDKVVERVAEILNVKPSEIWAPGKGHRSVQARSLLCYWAARELGITLARLSRKLKVSGRHSGRPYDANSKK